MTKKLEFAVEMALDTRAPLTEAQQSAVAQLGGGASGVVGGRRLETTLTVRAAQPTLAIEEGLREVLALVRADVVSVSATTIEEFDRRAAERDELVGVGEIATMLGVSKQRVTTLSKRSDFPAPIQRLASGPVWRARDLSTFKEGWQRKGGRPPKGPATTTSESPPAPQR